MSVKNYGNCDNCDKKLTKYHLEGRVLKFCSSRCHDIYTDNKKNIELKVNSILTEKIKVSSK